LPARRRRQSRDTSLNEEQMPRVRENMSEEEVVIFDILTRSGVYA
jgi:hypothetical protein